MSNLVRLGVSCALLLAALCSTQRVAAQLGADTASARLGLSVPAGGGQGPLTTWLAHTESDNVSRSAAGVTGAYESVGALFNVERNRDRLQSALIGTVEYRDYRSGAGKDEWLGTLGAFANVSIVPERFSWAFQQNFGQGRPDPFAPDTPQNRENISVFSTRPELKLPLGARTTLILDTSYSMRRYNESTLLDSDAVTYEMGVQRLTGPSTHLGLFVNRSEITYDQTTFGYEIQSAQAKYDRMLSKGSAHAVFGTNKLTLGESSKNGPVIEVAWQRNLTARSNLTLSANRGFNDTGRLFEFSLNQLATTPTDVLLSADATDRRTADVMYRLTLPRMDVALQVAMVEDVFARQTALDSDGRQVGVDIGRRLTPRLSLGAGVQKEHRTFKISGLVNEDTYERFWLTRRMTPHLSVELRVQKNQRAGTGAFEERAYQLTLIYIPRLQQRT